MEHVLRLYECWGAVAPVAKAAEDASEGAISATSSAASGDAEAGAGGAAAAAAGLAACTATEARVDEVAKSIMALNVKPHHMATFRTHSTARGVWEALAAEFLSHGRGDLYAQNLRDEQNTLKMGRNESAAQYVSRARTLAWKLQEMGDILNDQDLVVVMLDGVQPKFKMTRDVLLCYSDVTVSRVLRGLQIVEKQLACNRRC